ncbi:MAG: chromosomal replication initiator protein DnaA [Saprospiraceae bacterium]|nr:chromosomal replication initiator protein DnaA [Saprospiraceae bacterium]
MTKDHTSVWNNCIKVIEGLVSPQSFKTWFQPIQPVRLEGQALTIQVPNKFFYEWLEEHYVHILQKTLQEELGPNARLEYLIPRKTTAPAAYKGPTLSKDLEKNYGQVPLRTEKIKNPFVIPGIKKVKVDSQLNSEYTFDSFVEGDCNQLARSAGWAVAKRPGQTAFNPLMIFGNVGLGKTHLAHAIGNEVLNGFSDKTVLYVSSERFTNQFIEALRSNAISDFVNFYQLVDLLIVDDIQFLANKQKTQDIFFHIFNHLHQKGKQLILTSDRPPKELQGMEERLISRFKWGLSADLQVPSLETRMAIIQQKMENDGVDLAHDVAEYISHNVRTNVRELEGILVSLIAQAALNRREIDISLAREVISNFVEDITTPKEVSVEQIQEIVAKHYSLSLEDLTGKSRKRYIVIARKLSMYLMKQYSDMSLKNIGLAFGGRDHTTVMHACRSIEDMLNEKPQFRQVVEQIQEKLRR